MTDTFAQVSVGGDGSLSYFPSSLTVPVGGTVVFDFRLDFSVKLLKFKVESIDYFVL